MVWCGVVMKCQQTGDNPLFTSPLMLNWRNWQARAYDCLSSFVLSKTLNYLFDIGSCLSKFAITYTACRYPKGYAIWQSTGTNSHTEDPKSLQGYFLMKWPTLLFRRRRKFAQWIVLAVVPPSLSVSRIVRGAIIRINQKSNGKVYKSHHPPCPPNRFQLFVCLRGGEYL